MGSDFSPWVVQHFFSKGEGNLCCFHCDLKKCAYSTGQKFGIIRVLKEVFCGQQGSTYLIKNVSTLITNEIID